MHFNNVFFFIAVNYFRNKTFKQTCGAQSKTVCNIYSVHLTQTGGIIVPEESGQDINEELQR